MTNTLGSVDVNVVPRIYGASELGVLSIVAPGEAHPRVEYVGGELFVGLDAADGGAAITQGEVDAWPRPFGEALSAAIGSVASVSEPVDGIIAITDEALAAAVLLEPGRLAGASLDGGAVVFALSRDRLVAVGAEDEAGIGRVLDHAEELYDAGGPLVSAHPIVLADGAWSPFPWRERFPALEMRFERVLRLFSVRAYEAQGRVLQRPDVLMPDPQIRVLDSGVTTTFATWPKGVATLLPVVDNVVIADRDGGSAQLSVATFAQFLEAAGDAVVRTGLSPLRYFVPGEPPR